MINRELNERKWEQTIAAYNTTITQRRREKSHISEPTAERLQFLESLRRAGIPFENIKFHRSKPSIDQMVVFAARMENYKPKP